MRAAVLARRFGNPLEVLEVAPVVGQPLGSNEVAVRMIASPINPSDLIPVTGAYASRTTLPFIPGFEGVGVVDGCGDECTLSAGQRVIPIGSAGGWQTIKVLPPKWCIPVPVDIDDAAAATAYINPLTAVRMVTQHADSGDVRTAVVNAAGSAISGTIARLLRQRGIRTIGLGRHPEPQTHKRAGYWTEYLDTSREIGLRRLMHQDLLSEIDLAFDCVGGDEGTLLATSLREGGRLIHYGLLSGQPLSPFLQHQRPDIRIEYFRLRDWVHTTRREDLLKAFAEVFELIRQGHLRTDIRAEFPLGKALEAIRTSTQDATSGKILLRP
ncbi:zinc-dependent alcohol dehydrogenase family protein [Arthrobacter sp. USHLN218]|uniref:zinc-dependent alcohol dehydrogenase family protein n=1 Tax=Arthrobacter sp. USHLN218 TaxID=3081232 RepID=UPI003018ABB6